MPDITISLSGDTLQDLADDARAHELNRKLQAVDTDSSGNNVGIYTRTWSVPAGDIAILPAPVPGPAGATKIRDGQLTVGGAIVDVTVYRLS